MSLPPERPVRMVSSGETLPSWPLWTILVCYLIVLVVLLPIITAPELNGGRKGFEILPMLVVLGFLLLPAGILSLFALPLVWIVRAVFIRAVPERMQGSGQAPADEIDSRFAKANSSYNLAAGHVMIAIAVLAFLALLVAKAFS